jgi:hypothetical protein
MKKNTIMKGFMAFLVVALMWLFIAPDILEARRGSRGGSRSFGGSRSKTTKTTQKTKTPAKKPTSTAQRNTGPKPSFGGTRMNTSKDYTQKYGAPRKAEARTLKNAQGQDQRYVMNSYGGYGSGLMTGYMMGATPFLWATPFHPAFYYSRPYYVNNPDGTIGVYPPTFSWSKVFFTLIVVGIIVYIIYVIIRNKKRKARSDSQSSFV